MPQKKQRISPPPYLTYLFSLISSSFQLSGWVMKLTSMYKTQPTVLGRTPQMCCCRMGSQRKILTADFILPRPHMRSTACKLLPCYQTDLKAHKMGCCNKHIWKIFSWERKHRKILQIYTVNRKWSFLISVIKSVCQYTHSMWFSFYSLPKTDPSPTAWTQFSPTARQPHQCHQTLLPSLPATTLATATRCTKEPAQQEHTNCCLNLMQLT